MQGNLIETRKQVPVAYSMSRDYQVFLKLLDLIIDAVKLDIDAFINLINADKCPDHMLPALATYVGYKYDYNESFNANRLIIKYYPYLIRNRGSETGIRLAAALSVNSIGSLEDLELLSMFRIEYKREDNKINIYVYYPRYLSKIRDLIEVVRPAGVRLELIPADIITTIDKIDIYDYVGHSNPEVKYKTTNRYKVNENFNEDLVDENNDKVNRVGFGQVDVNESAKDLE